MRALMSQRDVLAFLGVGRQTLYEYRLRGAFPQPLLLGGKTARWLREEVELWSSRNRQPYRPGATWSVRDVLSYLGVSRDTLHEYRVRAAFPEPIASGGRERWRPEHVGEWVLAQHRGIAESRRRRQALTTTKGSSTNGTSVSNRL